MVSESVVVADVDDDAEEEIEGERTRERERQARCCVYATLVPSNCCYSHVTPTCFLRTTSAEAATK